MSFFFFRFWIVGQPPDYAILVNKKPRIIIDAKSPEENIYDWVEQCAHYCLILNREYEKPKVEYFLLSNGFQTALYKWDKGEPLVKLSFNDFWTDNPKYEKLRGYASSENIWSEKYEDTEKSVKIRKIDKEDTQKLFVNCHKYIWKSEKLSPAAAFMEFVKIIFLKLWNDKVLHDMYGTNEEGDLILPESLRTFSVKWIESRENDTPNPLNDLKYRELLDRIEDEIVKKNKKRMFNVNDKINLRPQTIKVVVKKLENYDLFGIDEDLNGRLFETFLSATMSGEALGQYFTPRSIVKLAVKLADITVNEKYIDKNLDACCGTGGFLIEALTDMRNKIRNNASYSKSKKEELLDKIADQSLYGMDAARDPMLARIARINMYLHGDGGSHIYFADSLDNNMEIEKTETREIQMEQEDLKENLSKIEGFDIVLTNPPFSMWYGMDNETEARILEQYELRETDKPNKPRKRLRSGAMFIERYSRLLKKGGKFISVIDETLLSSKEYDFVRDFIRKYFIIRAVISLHGDAFQMAKSRVKTSLIFLEKKKNINDQQPAAFMYPSIRLGVDDLPITSSKEKVREARRLAEEEIEKICSEFQRYKNGEKDFWLIPPDMLNDRLDVKICVPLQGRFVKKWEKKGYGIKKFQKLADLREEVIEPSKFPERKFKLLEISYKGRCRIVEEKLGKHINYNKMMLVRKGDLVVSSYNSFNGAIGFIAEDFDGALASNSYIILKCEDDIDALYLWSILRTTEMRSEFLSQSVGMGRQTINWDDVKDMEIPLLPRKEREKIYHGITEAWRKEKEIKKTFKDIKSLLDDNFAIESEESLVRFEAFKPPR